MQGFELSSVPPFLDGVYLGTNAVADAYLLIDCPSGCFFKCERIAVNHDTTSTLFHPMGKHRIVQSGINFGDLAMGSEVVLQQLVERVLEKVAPKALFLTQASPIALTSNDLTALAKRLTEQLQLPVTFLQADSLGGDYLDGFARFSEALVDLLLARSDPDGAAPCGDNEVLLGGYFADRLEADHRASIEELARLLGGLDLELAAVLCGGGELDGMQRAASAPTVIELPYAGESMKMLAERSGATRIATPLPVGLGGTVAWLQAIGEALQRQSQAERFIDRELAEKVPAVELARRRFLEQRSVAIAADPPLARGLVELAHELGMEVPLVSLRTRHQGAIDRFAAALDGTAEESEITTDMSVGALKRRLTAIRAERPIDILIGSSLERDVARDLQIGFVELGYPSFVQHAFFPKPLLGFTGTMRLVDDLVNAVQLVDYLRNSTGDRTLQAVDVAEIPSHERSGNA